MSVPAPPPPPPSYGQPGPYGVPLGTNKKAIWSLVLGILSFFCCSILTGIPAIILSRSAKAEIEATGGVQDGRGLATAGLVLGLLSIVLLVVWIALIASGAVNLTGSFSTSP